MNQKFFSSAFCILAMGFFMLLSGCGSNDVEEPVDCAQSDLAITVASTQNVDRCGATNGKIDVAATGGKAPYQFAIGSGALQTSTQFANLGAGTYEIKVVDANQCERIVSATLSAGGSSLAATAATGIDNQCLTDNGSITVTASGGTAPYQFKLDAGGFGTSGAFANVKNGPHVVLVKDADNCQITLNVTVPRGNTGISYANDIKPIIDARCAGSSCHGAGNGSRDFTNPDNLKSNASGVKSRTAGRSMPPAGATALTQEQIDRIGCWVDDGAPINN